MTEEELIQRTRTLIQKWDNVRIVGAGWAGDARRGFQFNPVQASFSPAGTTPPPPTPSGACCPAEGDCFIATQSICESGGGTYQGDDTTCDPNPCEMSCICGFDAFDGSGRKFLTKTTVASGTYDSPPPPGCTGTATNSWSSIRVDIIDPDTCVQTCVSATGSADVDVPWVGTFCTPCTSSGVASCSSGDPIFCGFGSSSIVIYTGCEWAFSPDDCNEGIQWACALCTPSSVTSATEETFTWSCNPAPGSVNINATQTITLSDECTPV